MPCFKGIAVSIHANGAPLPEHGIQKQSRVSRINSYIPVPQPQLAADSGKPEPAKFAISITLLTPGLPIPYSTPKATDANPFPKPQIVGELPSTSLPPASQTLSGGAGIVTPYIPMTNSENETIAAYIYFDGRGKEEVATLLRPGEETWVNSRWVQVPDAEGGGLAEREFLFREVGLERWLNGLDLEGSDAAASAAKLEKRRKRFEKRRRRQEQQLNGYGHANGAGAGAGAGAAGPHRRKSSASAARDTLRYGGADAPAPVEALDDDDLSDGTLSSDDELPEAAGQIKVAMFRVLASGEIKKGEYSPQFDAHDDDDAEGTGGSAGGVEPDVEHTTSFAKPKTLDPKTISTQTVTGIDGPDKPYATFTFFYRGERQLQKMGILPSSKAQQTPSETKRRSAQLDFSHIGPLKTAGTVGFSTFRDNETDPAARQKKAKAHKKNGSIAGLGGVAAGVPPAIVSTMDEDSDDDDDADDADDDAVKIFGKMDDDADDKDDAKAASKLLAPDDAKFSGELADGVNRIRLKRQHSVDPDSGAGSGANSFRKSPSAGPFGGDRTPTDAGSLGGGAASSLPGLSGASSLAEASLLGTSLSSTAGAGGGGGSSSAAAGGAGSAAGSLFGKSLPDDSVVGSPLKKHRASVAEGGDGDPRSVLHSGAFPPALGDILAKAEAAQKLKENHQPALGGAAASAATTTAASAAPAIAAATVREEDEDEEL